MIELSFKYFMGRFIIYTLLFIVIILFDWLIDWYVAFRMLIWEDDGAKQ